MPEAVAEPPVVTEPKSDTPSQKFHKAFSQINKRKLALDDSDSVPPDAPPKESAPKAAAKPEGDQPTPTPTPVDKPAPVKEPGAITKPSSALDAAIGEPKPAPVVEDKLPDKLEGATDKVNENWSKARAKIDRLEAELKAKPAPVQDNGLAALQEKYKALETRYNDQENRLKGIRRDQIKEALSGLEDDDKTTVKALMVKLSENEDAINEFRQDLPGKWDEISSKRDQQMRENYEANIKEMETQFGKITEEIPKSTVTLREVPDDVDGAEDWNKD